MTGFEWLIPVVVNNLVSVFKDDLTKGLKNFYTKISFHESLGKYRDRIIENYGYISLFGVYDSVYFEDGFFVDTYLIEEKIYNSTSENEIKSMIRSNSLEKTGVDFFEHNQNGAYYVLGDPGAGKSTFLKYLAYLSCTGQIKKIPIFVDLNTYANSKKDLMEYIVHEFAICGFEKPDSFIKYLLENGQLLLLFDGLDEVKKTNQIGKNRFDVIIQIKNLYKQFSNEKSENHNIFIVTCRHAANDFRFERFKYLVVGDFEPANIELYILNWFRKKDSEKGYQLITELFDPANYGIFDLARNPLLLSLLCYVYYRNQGYGFPKKKVDLYEEAVRLLLKDWDDSKGATRDELYKNLSIEGKMDLLSKIAYDNVGNKSVQARFSERDVKESISSYFINEFQEKRNSIPTEEIIKSIIAQHKMLKSLPGRLYSFAHLSFQEYFSAIYYVDRLDELLSIEKIEDDQWREVIFNTVSLLPTQRQPEFFNSFLKTVSRIIEKDPKISTLLDLANYKASLYATKNDILNTKTFYIYLIILSNFELDLRRDEAGYSVENTDNSVFNGLFKLGNLNLTYDFDFSRATAHRLSLIKDFPNIDERVKPICTYLSKLQVIFETENPQTQHLKYNQNIIIDYQIIILKLAARLLGISTQPIELNPFLAINTNQLLEMLTNNVAKLKDDNLMKLIKNILFPTINYKEEIYLASEETLDQILRIRGLKIDGPANSNQLFDFDIYLKSNFLLIECLKYASIENYYDIKDEMLSIWKQN